MVGHSICRRTFPNSKKKNELGCYTQDPKTVVPGCMLSLFSLGYRGLYRGPWDCSPSLHIPTHTNVDPLDYGIA